MLSSNVLMKLVFVILNFVWIVPIFHADFQKLDWREFNSYVEKMLTVFQKPLTVSRVLSDLWGRHLKKTYLKVNGHFIHLEGISS